MRIRVGLYGVLTFLTCTYAPACVPVCSPRMVCVSCFVLLQVERVTHDEECSGLEWEGSNRHSVARIYAHGRLPRVRRVTFCASVRRARP